jgi:hypothetical protein
MGYSVYLHVKTSPQKKIMSQGLDEQILALLLIGREHLFGSRIKRNFTKFIDRHAT